MVDLGDHKNPSQLKCWNCGGDDLLCGCPTRSVRKHGNYKVPKFMNELESKEVERIAEGLNPHVELEGQNQQEQHAEVDELAPKNPN